MKASTEKSAPKARREINLFMVDILVCCVGLLVDGNGSYVVDEYCSCLLESENYVYYRIGRSTYILSLASYSVIRVQYTSLIPRDRSTVRYLRRVASSSRALR